jgi:hypothetical protein
VFGARSVCEGVPHQVAEARAGARTAERDSADDALVVCTYRRLWAPWYWAAGPAAPTVGHATTSAPTSGIAASATVLVIESPRI